MMYDDCSIGDDKTVDNAVDDIFGGEMVET